MDKPVYYRMLADSRTNTLDEWIKYFLHKVSVQAVKHIGYIDALNALYTKTKEKALPDGRGAQAGKLRGCRAAPQTGQ